MASGISLSAYNNLRLGELLGLQWGDVEIGRKRILVRLRFEARTGQLKEPKTRAGTRFVEVPFVMTQLKEWKLRCPGKNSILIHLSFGDVR